MEQIAFRVAMMDGLQNYAKKNSCVVHFGFSFPDGYVDMTPERVFNRIVEEYRRRYPTYYIDYMGCVVTEYKDVNDNILIRRHIHLLWRKPFEKGDAERIRQSLQHITGLDTVHLWIRRVNYKPRSLERIVDYITYQQKIDHYTDDVKFLTSHNWGYVGLTQKEKKQLAKEGQTDLDNEIVTSKLDDMDLHHREASKKTTLQKFKYKARRAAARDDI